MCGRYRSYHLVVLVPAICTAATCTQKSETGPTYPIWQRHETKLATHFLRDDGAIPVRTLVICAVGGGHRSSAVRRAVACCLCVAERAAVGCAMQPAPHHGKWVPIGQIAARCVVVRCRDRQSNAVCRTRATSPGCVSATHRHRRARVVSTWYR